MCVCVCACVSVLILMLSLWEMQKRTNSHSRCRSLFYLVIRIFCIILSTFHVLVCRKILPTFSDCQIAEQKQKHKLRTYMLSLLFRVLYTCTYTHTTVEHDDWLANCVSCALHKNVDTHCGRFVRDSFGGSVFSLHSDACTLWYDCRKRRRNLLGGDNTKLLSSLCRPKNSKASWLLSATISMRLRLRSKAQNCCVCILYMLYDTNLNALEAFQQIDSRFWSFVSRCCRCDNIHSFTYFGLYQTNCMYGCR